eukprot:bmy_15174T0
MDFAMVSEELAVIFLLPPKRKKKNKHPKLTEQKPRNLGGSGKVVDHPKRRFGIPMDRIDTTSLGEMSQKYGRCFGEVFHTP